VRSFVDSRLSHWRTNGVRNVRARDRGRPCPDVLVLLPTLIADLHGADNDRLWCEILAAQGASPQVRLEDLDAFTPEERKERLARLAQRPTNHNPCGHLPPCDFAPVDHQLGNARDPKPVRAVPHHLNPATGEGYEADRRSGSEVCYAEHLAKLCLGR